MSDAIVSPPAVGDAAPDFALPDDTGATRRLEDQRGDWVVLFFYPKDFTSGCTIEVCEFRDNSAALRDAGAEVFGISVLDSDSKAAFKAEHGLDYPLLADEDHAVAERYGVWVEKMSYGKTQHGRGADDVPRRSGRAHRPRLAQGLGRGPRGGCPRAALRRTSAARRGSDRPPARCIRKGVARGGRRATSLAEDTVATAGIKPLSRPWRVRRARDEPGVNDATLRPRTMSRRRGSSSSRAHPGDADRALAGSVARWVAEGGVAHLVCCTSGDASADDASADPLEVAALASGSSVPRLRAWATRP